MSAPPNPQTTKLKVSIVAPSPRYVGGQSVQADLFLRLWQHDPDIAVSFLAVDPPLLRAFAWAERISRLAHHSARAHLLLAPLARSRKRRRCPHLLRFATDINPHTIQVSLAAPYPGTFLFDQALQNGWLDEANAELVNDDGVQIAPLHYPHLTHTEIFNSVEDFYRRFYFRSGKIASIVGEMVRSPQMMKRRLREGVEFFHFLRERSAARRAYSRKSGNRFCEKDMLQLIAHFR